MTNLSSELITIISPVLAWKYHIVPIDIDEKGLTLLLEYGSDKNDLLQELSVITNKKIIPKFTHKEEINDLLNRYYRISDDEYQGFQNDETTDFLKNIILEASNLKSSDIHIEIYEQSGRIRFRIDGQLIERHRLENLDYYSLINKIKILSNLNITEKRLPQDGRINLQLNSTFTDIRVSIIPSYFGEKVVLRILSNDASYLSILDLGFTDNQLQLYRNNIKKNKGMILVSGPTGSGKTTTLYSTLKELNSPEKNIITVEDPIEYTLHGINQVQLKESIGLSFSSVLRSFLRQDPDIIMIGEIRDEDTAQIAIRAALTGHLVLSTIHTNDAIGIINRLVDLGIPHYLIVSTVNIAVAQRLLRKLCSNCKIPKSETLSIFSSKGCKECFFTGYKGRIAIYEAIEINSEFDFLLQEGHSKEIIYKQLGIISLKESAQVLYEKGITSYEEICSIVEN